MKKILLDAGHGGDDDGAQAAGVREDDIALNIALKTEDRLRHLMPSLEIHQTRVRDEFRSLKYRYEAIMDISPDVFVSIHCNAIPDNPNTPYDDRKYAYGFEIFYRDEEDLKLAKAIERVMSRSDLWEKNRGIKQDVKWLNKRLAVLNNFSVPSVLIEPGFLSNDNDRKIILDNQDGIADLFAHGILDFVNAEERE